VQCCSGGEFEDKTRQTKEVGSTKQSAYEDLDHKSFTHSRPLPDPEQEKNHYEKSNGLNNGQANLGFQAAEDGKYEDLKPGPELTPDGYVLFDAGNAHNDNVNQQMDEEYENIYDYINDYDTIRDTASDLRNPQVE
jgi:hypothetical protein